MRPPSATEKRSKLQDLRNSLRDRLNEAWGNSRDAMISERSKVVTEAHYELYRTLESARTASSMLEVAAEFAVATGQLDVAFEDQFEATYLMGSHENSPVDLGRLNAGLGSILDGMGRSDEAMSYYKLALEFLEKGGKDGDPVMVASVENNMAMTLKHEGDLDGAKAVYKASLERLKGHEGEDPELAASLKYNYAVLLQDLGEDVEAAELFLEALDERIEALGADHPDTGLSQVSVAIVYALSGDEGEALLHFAAAEPVLRKHVETMRDEYEALIANYTIFLRNQGRHGEAEALEGQAAQVLN